jgi:hypothetical protein
MSRQKLLRTAATALLLSFMVYLLEVATSWTWLDIPRLLLNTLSLATVLYIVYSDADDDRVVE